MIGLRPVRVRSAPMLPQEHDAMPTLFRSLVFAACLVVAALPAVAATATIKGSPSVTVEVPRGFEASHIERGLQIETPDEEVMVWFETYKPKERDTLVEEHEAYWKEQGVELGQSERTSHESGGLTVAATTFDNASWKGDRTVVRYLFIDGGFRSQELILMTIWASPDGINAHGKDVSKIVDSIDVK